MLRLRLGPEAALEIAEEGPPLGSRDRAGRALRGSTRRRASALAVFVSDGCHVCHALEPAIAALARDPLVAVETFEERLDAEVWEPARDPGQPVRDRPRPRRHGARQGHVQQPRPARERARRRRAPPRRARDRRGDRCLSARSPARAARRARSSRSPATPRAAASSPGSAGRSPRSPPAAWSPGRSSPARPTPFTSAATSSRPARARTRPGPAADRRPRLPAARRRRPAGRQPRPAGQPPGRAGRRRRRACCATPTGGRCRRRRGPRSATRPARVYGSRPHVDGGWYRCCERPRAQARRLLRAPRPADQRRRRRSRATATAAARSSASCTSRPRCRADGRGSRSARPRGRGARRRAHRHLVAVRLLDDRDDRPGRPHAAAGRPRSPPASRSRSARWPAACSPSARWPRSASSSTAPATGRLCGGGGASRSPPRSPSCAASPIVPQVRRQLPEHWRRVMPMPVAAGLYGVLLGLGFTTFVLTFGVFALAGIALAVGEPAVGVAVGLAFGDRPGAADRAASPRSPTARRHPGHRADGRAARRSTAAFASATGSRCSPPPRRSWSPCRPSASQTDAAAGGRPGDRRRGRSPSSGPTAPGVLRQRRRDVALPGHDPALGDGRVAVIARRRDRASCRRPT